MEELIESLNDVCKNMISRGFAEGDVYGASSQAANCINWLEARNQISKCDKCLWHSHSKPLGFGSIDAKLFIVGEYPEILDERTGVPFSSLNGNLLTIVLNKLGIERKSVYTTNAIKCTPRNNNYPTEKEIKICSEYLETEISLVKPSVVVTMGETAAISLSESDKFKYHLLYKSKYGYSIMHTYSTQSILQETGNKLTKMKSAFWQDMKSAFVESQKT